MMNSYLNIDICFTQVIRDNRKSESKNRNQAIKTMKNNNKEVKQNVERQFANNPIIRHITPLAEEDGRLLEEWGDDEVKVLASHGKEA
jgi:hypothetical protein